MADAINDIVGKPDIGTLSSGKVDGSYWQFGIAVPINNRKFEFGKIMSYTVAADDFSQSYVDREDVLAGVSASNSAVNTAPGNYIQYGDKVIFGPSTNTTDTGYSESIRVSGATHDNHTDATQWANGIFHFLDRKNKYRYELSDPVTVVGTGMADGWHLSNLEGSTLGIKRGWSCLNSMGRYAPNLSGVDKDTVDGFEQTSGDNVIGLTIKLPDNSGSKKDVISGPQHGSSGSGKGPAIFNSALGIAPWRNALYPQAPSGRNWDWAGSTSTATINYFGIFRYIHQPYVSDTAKLVYDTNSTTPLGGSHNLGGKNTYAGILTGFTHSGGQYKDTAQALFTMVNGLSQISGSNKITTSLFSQILTRSENDSKDAKYSKLVSGTTYRLGITYKGNLKPDNATNTIGSEAYAKFQWQPSWATGTIDHYANSMISTTKLFSTSIRNVDSWNTAMSSGYVDVVGVDQVDTTDSIRIDIVSKAGSDTAYGSTRQLRGSELLMFVDNIWLEHEGDIANASGNGYVELQHFPEQGSLQTNRNRQVKPSVVTLSDGSSQVIDSTGTMNRWLYKITAGFVNVKQIEWQKIKELLQWQDLGYRLTCHPFLPGIPHCLVGELIVNNVNKSFWDLTRFSFQLIFTETE
jgi:hypothetical protein